MKREIWVTIVIVIIIFIIIMSSPATSVVSSSLKSLQTHFRLWCAIIYQPSADHSLADADAATTHVGGHLRPLVCYVYIRVMFCIGNDTFCDVFLRHFDQLKYYLLNHCNIKW